MGNYKSKPSWWQLVEAVRELCKISQLWNAGKITNESAMRSVCEILKGVNHV